MKRKIVLSKVEYDEICSTSDALKEPDCHETSEVFERTALASSSGKPEKLSKPQ